ncbi:hypothetical protein BJY04DRAFT_225929 [Aspergillus karnatakaensis]|uniref:Zn(II)2Cys6 transcription factor n=1 Tax=Aspergillus karnatakaensis TaxID=1810916 RepID=UPI003CCCBE10
MGRLGTARTRIACTACRERKIKCSGNQPCRYCTKRNRECVIYETRKRKLYSIAYVEDLERRVASQGQLYAIADDGRATPAASSHEDIVGPSLDLADSSTSMQQTKSTGSAIEMDMLMSSSVTFSSHIKAISDARSFTTQSRGWASKISDNAYDLILSHGSEPAPLGIEDWPTEEQAQGLVDTVTASIGSIQHLFDPRSLSDRLSAVYDQDESIFLENAVSTAELLMVLAVGKLLQGSIERGEPFPGFSFFTQALKYVQDLCSVSAAGALGVEVMGLMAFYLQCADRKEDAYLYAGMGLRVAILMNLHRDSGGTSTKRSERAHCNRLWWTIYMQERRLAAATGNPPGIQDEAIRASYPDTSPGFNSPAAITVNIKIAKTTGEILQVIYGQKAQTEQAFVKGVQRILVSLHQISGSIPKDLELDFSTQPVTVTRSKATLYLMLYQAIMLATRPTLLHLAGKIAMKNENHDVTSEPLHQFVEACIDAAKRSLAILSGLRSQRLLANFGFFDLDAIFSVAFVFVLAGTIHPGKESCWRDINLTLHLLDHLSSHGNKAAYNRRVDILQMCEHLGISREQNDNNTQANPISACEPEGTSAIFNPPVGIAPPVQDSITPVDFSEPALQWVTEIDELLLQQDPHDFYSLYSNNGLPLVGTIETDWEALENQIYR